MTAPTEAEIREAAGWIRTGKLVAFPTETVYGLGANALSPDAVRRIFEVKGRPSSSPLIVHVDSVEMAQSLVMEWPPEASVLAGLHWPGPLTLVLLKKPVVPDEVTAGLATVGVRVPAHPVALALIRESGCPIAAPSANRFTELSPTSAEHVRRSLGGRISMILDGGPTPVGIESTVLSLAGSKPVLLRPGMVSREEIEARIGPIELAGSSGGGARPSPGMHPRHYSPRTPLFLGTPPTSGRGETLAYHGETAREYAAALYASLHDLDQRGLDWIAVELPPRTPEWAGIHDRLRRAAARITEG
ncbi:MAG: threonylcarbamoyl-AMP synthase [Bryobacterales bacterium]|nr:threonylcarbamoyl-AMP synthase [Bryobacterales bacterium]